MEKHKCQCPSLAVANPLTEWMYEPQEMKARAHAPNECPGDYQMTLYWRKGNYIWLCSACCLPSDVVAKGVN